MNEISDEKIQQWLEAGKTLPLVDQSGVSHQEFVIYQQIFEVLEQAPVVNLPPDFGTRLRLQIQNRRERRRTISFAALLILLSILGIGGAIFVIGIDNILVIASLILQYKWVIISGLVGFCGLQYLDQRLMLRQGGWV